ncbi:MAG: hypothetical protein ACRCT8_00005 [Lacipirellulaceae bacterium]
MARQDQNLQIGLIISAILVVILGGVAYWNYRLFAAAELRVADLTTQKGAADNAAREKIQVAESYLAMIGQAADANATDVQKQFEDDQKRYMQNFDEASRNYRSVLDYIYEENQKIAQQEAESKGREKSLKERLVALEAEKEAQVAEIKATLDKTQQDLAAERASFNDARQQLERQRQDLTKTLDSSRQDFETKLADAEASVAKAQTELTDSETSRNKLLEERELESPSFEVADGRVTYVNQANQTVWINLGEADALRRQITFSVFESELSDAGKAAKKGSIEVTRLLGEHLAEARVTSDDKRNPILPGDQVYSQVWQRGKKLRFALTGLVDLDGDGTSDLQQAKDLIALNGAVVDSSIEEDGTIDGEMTVNTRYLVLGEYPNAPSKAKIREAFNTMSDQADKKGVEVISLDEFMSQMGYEPQEKTAPLGGGSASGAAGRPQGPGRGGRYVPFRTP